MSSNVKWYGVIDENSKIVAYTDNIGHAKKYIKKHSKNDTSKSLIKRSFLLCNFQKLKYMEKLLYSLIPFSAFSKFSDSHFPSTFTINAGKSCNIISSSVTFLASFSYMFILSSIATL